MFFFFLSKIPKIIQNVQFFTKVFHFLILCKCYSGMQLCSDGKAEEVEAFFANRTYPSIAMTLKNSIEKIRIKARWVHNIREEHDSDLLHLVMQLAEPTN